MTDSGAEHRAKIEMLKDLRRRGELAAWVDRRLAEAILLHEEPDPAHIPQIDKTARSA